MMTEHSDNLSAIPTPALLLDRARVGRNCRRMSDRAAAAGIALRPHIKTAKSAEVAALATQGHPGGITVSTLAEAGYFADRGYSDLMYAVCAVPDKLARVAALQRGGAQISLITDDVEVARALGARAHALGARFRVLIEIDSGEHRTGVIHDGDALLAIADAVADAPALALAGVLTHAGHSYGCRTVAEIAEVAEDERRQVVGAAERLRAAGHPCEVVSAGSTPTAVCARSFDGLTEIRPGAYVFFDLAQHALGACELEDIAISVLATVISHRPAHGRLVIDAGGLALSKDISARLPAVGYGWVCDVAGRRVGDLYVAIADQEHGYVESASGAIPFDRLPIGSRVRVLPNHACMTAAAHDRYEVIEGGAVVDRWDRINGW